MELNPIRPASIATRFLQRLVTLASADPDPDDILMLEGQAGSLPPGTFPPSDTP